MVSSFAFQIIIFSFHTFVFCRHAAKQSYFPERPYAASALRFAQPPAERLEEPIR